MFILENENLKVAINSKGAELTSLYDKKLNLDRMWNGDPLYWNKHSPVLFPIVGALKDNTYYLKENSYHLNRHGFGREMVFAISKQTGTSITFTLESNTETWKNFPFHFRFDIIYHIHANSISVLYRVLNNGKDPIWFSVGGHPAFKLPFIPDSNYNDYFLEFNELESCGRWPVSKEGLIEMNSTPLLNKANRIPLSKELFYKDALVFKDLRSTNVKLLSSKSIHGLELDFTGFPFLGIWAAKDADFLCIEPWCGIADSVNTNQRLEDKEGINRLDPQDEFKREWIVRVF